MAKVLLFPLQKNTPKNRDVRTSFAGMGELHLDVIKDRILKEYGVDVYLGPLQIAYKETVTRPGEGSYTLDQTVGTVEAFLLNRWCEYFCPVCS